MPDFSTVEDTLFVPMLGRIYATENFPDILNDKKALSLKPLLPENLKGENTQTQYTLMASAVRSTNMDRYIQDFMNRHRDGIIVNLGCGLETTFFRNDNGRNTWYEVDLPDVIEYRKKLLPESEREILFAGSAFEEDWIKKIREDFPEAPVLVTASGLFYYFESDVVLALLSALKHYGKIEVVFDTVNSSGMKRMSKYMKQVGHEDAMMFFYVDSAAKLGRDVGAIGANEEAYYAHTKTKGLKVSTKVSMKVSDKYMMVKMVHLIMN